MSSPPERALTHEAAQASSGEPGGPPFRGPASQTSAAFSARLNARIKRHSTTVCLGLDPRPEAHPLTHPERHDHDAEAVASAVARYFGAILASCHELIACCKPQSAFFEALGVPGLRALQEVLEQARALGVPVVLDAKRGDIGSTAAAYAEAYLAKGPLAADALTVNPYLGLDTLEPFVERATLHGRGLFVLVRTSNPGSADLQGLRLAAADERSLYRHLATLLAARASSLPHDDDGYTLLGAVVGASHSAELRSLRELLPASLFLVPGYGAQGGTAASVAPAFDAHGLGAIVSASRSLTYAKELSGLSDLDELGAAVRARVETMRADLQAVAPAAG